jgi:hypothetical protein
MSNNENTLPEGVTETDLRRALRDIIGEKTPKHVSIEYQKVASEPGWEGNVYKYSF